MRQIDAINQRINGWLEAANSLAVAEIERMAREVLAKRSDLNEFILGMGKVFFTTKDDENLELDDDVDTKELGEFIREWDDFLHLTGNSMRFTATGPKITSW